MTQASYVRGNSAPPLIGDTIGAYFDKIVDRFGESEALVARHQNLRWTYRQLRRRVDNLASNLAWLGLEPGDRIGIWSQNNAQWLLIQLASAKAGLILVNLNPAYQRNELKYALNKVQCKALIVARGFRGNDYLAMLHELAPELSTSAAGFLASAALPSLRLVITLDDARMPGVRTSMNCSSTPVPTIWRGWRHSARGCTATTRSTSSSPREPPALPRPPR